MKPLWDDLPLRRYLREVATRMGVVEILALDNLRDLPRIRIETIYVPPLLAEYAVDVEGDPKRWPAGQNLLETLTEHRRLVVLGDPGGGKTTLANWLAWRLSAGLSAPLPPFLADKVPLPCVLRELPPDVVTEDTPLDRLVEHIVRRLLGDKASDELRATLHARVAAGKYVLILDGIDEIPLTARDQVRNWVRTASGQDACVLATSRVVGYDDLPVDRITLVDRLRKWFTLGQRQPPDLCAGAPALFSTEAASDAQSKVWHDWWGDKQTIATVAASPGAKIDRDRSKRGDAGPPSLDGEAARAEPAWAVRRYLMPFDDARIAAFASNWYSQRCASEIEAREKAADLVAAVSRHAVTLRLARTPNLLTLMAVVHRERADLPDGKAVLYDEIANAYINTIDSGRKLPGVPDRLAHHDWKERKSWLAYVAFRLQKQRSAQDEKSGILAGESDVRGWLAEAMERSGVAEAPMAARDYLGWVARRSGLLLPRGEGLYAFVHLSFQEYFCACHLAQRMLSPAYVRRGVSSDGTVSRKVLCDWAGEALWRETFVFLFEKLSAERDAGWIEDLADAIFPKDSGHSSSLDENDPRLRLAARILGDRHVRLDELTKERLIGPCVNAAWVLHISNRTSDLLLLLIEGNLACIARGGGSDALPENLEGVPYRTSAELHGLGSPTMLRLLIVRDRAWSESSALSAFPALVALNIGNTQVSDVSPLAALTGLQWLSLDNTQVSDVSPLAALTGLQKLSLDNTQVSDVSPLAALTGLQVLSLTNTQVSDVSPLAALTGLQVLSLDNTQVSDVSPLAALTGLQGLLLDNTQVSDVSPLAALTGLQVLSLGNTQVSDVSPLAALTGLQTLSLRNTQVSDVSPLAALTGLQGLSLTNTQVSDVSPLAALTGLQELSLGNTQVSDVSPLAALTGLQTLSLTNTQVSDVSPLAALTGLQTLSLINTQVSDVSPLAALTGLQTLWLDNTQISDVSPLAVLTGLQELSLDDTEVSDVSPLAALTGLQGLLLDNTQVSDVSPLAALTGLQVLSLDNTQVSDVSPLAVLTGLQGLSLTNTQVSDVSPLAALTGLQKLWLDNTQVSDVSPLAALTGLQKLSLANTQVSDVSPLAALTGLQ
ncbi:leucine-rich repeat domain-containing protein [Candidatus Accumulibacter phosphatis]|uniref:leucine-rich repeat domain-containing protein n=1 Tax=Candidatus Accumulibacter phosphatis TaxID=327160 RepID=UPI0039B91938